MANDAILKVRLEGATEEIQKLTLLQDAVNQLSEEKKKLNATQREQAKALDELNTAYNEGKISQDEYKKQTEGLEQENLKLAASQVEVNVQLKEAKGDYKEAEKAMLDSVHTDQAKEGSIAAMRIELSKAQKEYINLSEEERNNEQIGGKLQKQIKAQSDELKGLEKEIGITSRSVGDYGQAVQGVLPLMGGFGAQLNTVIGSLGEIQETLKGAIVPTKGFGRALLAIPLMAIAAAVLTLVGAFASTQRGMDAITSVTRPLIEVFQSLWGLVQNLASQGFDRLKEAINNPKQALKDFGQFIQNQFMNRLKGVGLFLVAFKDGTIASFKLLGLGVKKALADVPLIGRGIDQEKLKKDLAEAQAQVLKAAKDTASATLQIASGLDKEQQKAVANSIKGVVSEGLARGKEIDKLTKQLEKSRTSLDRRLSDTNILIEKQREISQDVSKTDAERLKAAKEAQRLIGVATKMKADDLNMEIKLMGLKQQANDTDREAQKELEDLIGQRNQIEADGIRQSTRVGAFAFGIKKKQQDAAKKGIEDEKKAEEERSKAALDNRVKELSHQEKMLQLERNLVVATTEETADERFQKEMELQEKLSALRLERAKLNGEDEKQIELENQIAKFELIKEEKARQFEIEKEMEAEQKEQRDMIAKSEEDLKQQVRQQGIELARQAGDALIQVERDRLARQKDIQLASLNAELMNKTISQEEFEAKKLAIEKEAFKKNKKLQLATLAMSYAQELGAIAAAAAANPANAVTFGAAGVAQFATLAAIATARNAIQAGIIGSQKFAKGGLLKGASHEQGGIATPFGEMEGGEAVINKNSTKKFAPILSAINQMGGGVPIPAPSGGMAQPSMNALKKFREGGFTGEKIKSKKRTAIGRFFDTAPIDEQNEINRKVKFKDDFYEELQKVKVINVATDTGQVDDRVKKIQNSATF
jgi:hypothetical protein